MKSTTVPHPIPYQGSKRNLAGEILRYFPPQFNTLIEPFAGSAAITIAAAANGLGVQYHLNDLNEPLADLWRSIIQSPEEIASQYEALWLEQHADPCSYYDQIRSDFNRAGKPDLFLYLLARCVKGSVRYNSQGEFNQSPDNRRRGMKHFIEKCRAVTAKRPRTIIEHILKHGYITTEEIKERYGYSHPPRAARDVREHGIPLETFRVTASDGRSIGAYRFGDPADARFSRRSGRTAFSKALSNYSGYHGAPDFGSRRSKVEASLTALG